MEKKNLPIQVKKNDAPISEILKDFTHQKKISKGYNKSAISKLWKEKMGAVINEHTKKISYNNGILYIIVDSAPLKHQLFVGKEKIISILNKELGEDLIKAVNIK